MLIRNCYKTYDVFLNQYDENFQKEIENDMKIFF